MAEVFTTALLLVVVVGGAALMFPRALGLERSVVEDGSLAWTHRVPVPDLRVGDVLLAGTEPRRVVALDESAPGTRVVTTQGDPEVAPTLTTLRLTALPQAVVAATVPHLGHVVTALAQPHVRTALLAVPAGLVLLLGVRELVLARRRAA